MNIISQTEDFYIEGSSAVAIGKFDGIHLGHRKILKDLTEQKADGLQAVVFTFDPSPASFFSGKRLPELSTQAEKRRAFERLGIDVLVEYPLNRESAATPPERFITQTLVQRLHAKVVSAGKDLSFGNRGAGNFALLRSMAPACGYEPHLIEKVRYMDREISSTFVREEVAKGDMETAGRLLGAPYQISGVVAHGRRIGRTIGFPTLNLLPPGEKLLPPCGVYFSRVHADGACWNGLTNIGSNPTVTDDGGLRVETFLYDFDADLYGAEIEVFLLHRHREERRFSDIDALRRQILSDKSAGSAYFS